VDEERLVVSSFREEEWALKMGLEILQLPSCEAYKITRIKGNFSAIDCVP